MPSKDTKVIIFNQYQKADKALLITYANLECLMEKIGGCKNNPENASTTKVDEHFLSGFSMSTIFPFKSIANKHDMYRCKDCMKSFVSLQP